MLVDAAVHAYGMTTVPLYDTLGPDTVKYIANHAELAAICCSPEALPAVLEVLPGAPSVKLVVVYAGRPHARLPAPPPGAAARLLTLDRLRALGARHPAPHRPPRPRDVALLNYTSGTTGAPKGAVLSHAALVANAAGAAAVTAALFAPGAGTRHISYLPLAHIYERFNVTMQTYLGGAIGFYRGDVLALLEDVEALRPTAFASVPRLYNRIYDRVLAQVGVWVWMWCGCLYYCLIYFIFIPFIHYFILFIFPLLHR
jgi:long-chain acyl-CoA synthetase